MEPKDVKEIDRPVKVMAVLDGKESFKSGHWKEDDAIAQMNLCNKQAEVLGIKTRYITKGEEVKSG